MNVNPTTAPAARRTSRLVRFSLRILLLATTVVAIGLGILAYNIQCVKRERIAVLHIEELGGRPIRILRDGRVYTGGKLPAMRFKWIHEFLGDDYYIFVPANDVSDPSITADKFR